MTANKLKGEESERRGMDRRTFLTVVGAGVTTGCVSESSNGEENGEVPEEQSTSLGNTVQLPNGAEVSVSNLRKEEAFTYDNPVTGPSQMRAERGEVFVFADVTATNPTEEEITLPFISTFLPIVGDSQYEVAAARANLGDAYEGGDVQPGITREGRIIYEVSEDTSLSDAQIVYSESIGDARVTWE